jgi:hypothetical protein
MMSKNQVDLVKECHETDSESETRLERPWECSSIILILTSCTKNDDVSFIFLSFCITKVDTAWRI